MKVGDPVRVHHLDSYPGKPLCGYVEAIAPAHAGKEGIAAFWIDPVFDGHQQKAQAALDQAKASLSQIEAQRHTGPLYRAFAEVCREQATVDASTAAAATTHASVDQAMANLAFEREQFAVIDANETAAKAQVASAEANLLSSKFALQDTEIWSPIDGLVANRKTRVGEYVTYLWIEANYRETLHRDAKIARVDANDDLASLHRHIVVHEQFC